MRWLPAKLARDHSAAIARQFRALSDDRQRQLQKRCRRTASRDWRVLICVVVGCLFAIAAGAVMCTHTPRRPLPLTLAAAVSLLGGSFLIDILSNAIKSRIHSQQMSREFPWICRTCGHDLRATPSRCPECGTTTHDIPPSPITPSPSLDK